MPSILQRDMHLVTFHWVPWNLELRHATFGHDAGCLIWYGWLLLGPLTLTFNMEPESDEHPLLRVGPFTLARPETDEERKEREYWEADEEFCRRESMRYCEWYY